MKLITKYVTMMENAQVHIIILNLNTITINGSNTPCMQGIQLFDILFLFRLGCNVGGDAGNGTTQGTCPNDNQLCHNDGNCSGTHYCPKP